jgi:glycosyltransferase involved in cell wall biosynthesis
MMNGDVRPPLCAAGQALVVTESFPPRPGGSSTVMSNLLACFDPASFTVATGANTRGGATETLPGMRVHRLVSSPAQLPYRVRRWWHSRQLDGLSGRLLRLVKRERPAVIVGVYPDLHFLRAAREVAREASIPWAVYLHDTMAESEASGPNAAAAAELQEHVFAEASEILVMSRGIADLYWRKYGLECTPVEHIYPEPSGSGAPEAPLPQVFWGGSFHTINSRALARVSRAVQRAGRTLLLTTHQTGAQLASIGVTGAHVRTAFFSRRSDYLRAVRSQGVLLLALDGPDESTMHPEELATIFPTKTPEYLAAGRPILVHCPEHYFLARFIREHGCGLVVSDRSAEALAAAIERLLSCPEEARSMVAAARGAVSIFGAERVSAIFKAAVERTARCSWGERAGSSPHNPSMERRPRGAPLAPGGWAPFFRWFLS